MLKTLCCKARSLSEGPQLCPSDSNANFAIAGRRLKAAIITKDHIFGSDDTSPAFHAVGNELGMLDHHIRMGDSARYQHLSRWQLDMFEQMEFMFMTRIGCLEGISAGTDCEDEIDHVLELQITHPWPEIDAIACMEANTILGQPTQHVIEMRDSRLGSSAIIGHAHCVTRGIPGADQAWKIDLQQKPASRIALYSSRIASP
jgi:hypothetical protein